MVGQIAIVILVLFSYPLQCHPCRASIRNIITWIKAKRSNSANYTVIEDDETATSSPLETSQPVTPTDIENHHLLITSLVIAFSLITALRVKSLEVMLAFVGSTGSTSISFILPGLFSYKLLTLQKLEFINPWFHEKFYGVKTVGDEASSRFSLRDNILRLVAISLFFWGVLVLVVCLGINIVNFA